MFIKFLIPLSLFTLGLRFSSAGYCSETYTCPSTCHRRIKYKTRCGLFNLFRCTRYRQQSYTCTKTCTRQVCCSGYTGSKCTTALCYGQTSCPNGGKCVAPDQCQCTTGFSGSRCADIDECASGAAGCGQICTNTAGSFKCSCRSGFILASDRKNCYDINECGKNNGGCEHKCKNQQGSYVCQCSDGYRLNKDHKTCSDVNECAMRISKCEHECTNTVGLYKCSCHQGFVLALDGHHCEDIDECADGTSDCNHFCSNTVGSFTCSCKPGYQLQPDGKTCQDIDECMVANGGCEQVCNNSLGSYSCACRNGFRLNPDGVSCTDINECEEKISGCSQTCTNTDGSFKCGCDNGYKLDSDGKSCTDIDDCVNVICQNGGSCLDEVASFSCLCKSGFTGEFCESDIDECSFLNGGCQDMCTNKHGSFKCSCKENRTLSTDGVSCTGHSLTDNVFKRHHIPRTLLPVGCSVVLLTKCTDGKDIEVYLSSTSDWLMLKSNNNVLYTYGIVFVEVNSLSLPISLSGVEVYQNAGEFTIKIDVNGHQESAGIPINDRRSGDCLSFDVTPRDIFDFISNVSFLKSFLTSLTAALPDWVKLAVTNTSVLNVQDLRSELVYGSEMDHITWCKGAPVLPAHLYSVFQFDSNFLINVYGAAVKLPKPLKDHQFCLIVDICHNYGGSVFLMVPEESQSILSSLDVFKRLQEKQGLLIKPRGIGISVVKGINVHYAQTQLKFWNGDRMFHYTVMGRADLWISGEVVKQSSSFEVEGIADLYVSVPRPDRLLIAMFIDEWNTLLRIKATFTPTLKFKLFGKQHSITFDDLAAGKLDAYLSVGGTHVRQWCGELSNPPGIFLSTLIKINPFQNVPILKDWVIENVHILYAYITTDPSSKINKDMQIDILKDIIELDEMVGQFENLFKTTLKQFDSLLSNVSIQILNRLEDAIHDLQTSISTNMNILTQGDISGLADILSELWKHIKKIETTVIEFLDLTEHYVVATKDTFISLIKNETANIKQNIHQAIGKLTDQVSSAVKDYSGFGLKYTTTIALFGLRLPGIDIEIVSSTSNLMLCTRFDKVKTLLQGEDAMRFLGRANQDTRLGNFLKLGTGAGVGGAFGIDTKQVILQLNAYVNIIGIKTTGDLFISQKGIYFYLEGNIWDIFLAQVDVSAEVGKAWHQLTFTLQGRFVAKARRKRQTQRDSSSFQDSYLDGLKKVTKLISNEADKRLTQAQNGLAKAQTGLSNAQDWLDDKKNDVRKANAVFDKGVAALEAAKDKLEKAKGPFKRAIEKLEKAQKKVDNLCRIKSCNKVCIPGLKCKICHKKVWRIRIPYPCCKWTKCMISFPNPVCVAANLICRGVRAIAFVALEAAKVFVKVPMLALDVAKSAVSVAQFAVDKSRVVLKLAEGVLEVAKMGLEAAKGVVEVAKMSLEALKIAVGAAAKVLEFVIEYGLKNILDVRNCGFNIEVSTVDLPVFDVSCEVNAFKLGWKNIQMRINFKNIFQSIWQAAKATINTIMKGLRGLVSGRKRRDLSFDATSNIHLLLRKVRQSSLDDFNGTTNVLNETINIINSTKGFHSSVEDEYGNRVLLFKQKCTTVRTVLSFLKDTWETLFDIINDTKTVIDEASHFSNQLVNYDLNAMTKNLSLETAGISIHHAISDYNLTQQDLDKALEDAKLSFFTDPLLHELSSTADFSKETLASELKVFESSSILNNWILAMENLTKSYFNQTDCVDFRDCVFFAISELYELYTEETHPNITEIKNAIIDLEDNLLTILSNTSQDIQIIYNSSLSISENLQLLSELNIFCLEPPRFLLPLSNVTVARAMPALMECQAIGDPPLRYWWYKNGELMTGVFSSSLLIANATDNDEAIYQCVVGNDVANITSNEGYLDVVEHIDDFPELVEAECEKYGCQSLGPCYIPHPTSCFKFIMCKHSYGGKFSAQVMPCAFGTMWKSEPVPVCEHAKLVKCKNDPCLDPSVKGYDNADRYNRTFWKCVNGRSVPDCCPKYMRYDNVLGKCVEDSNSDHLCPLINDDTCSGGHVQTINFPDGNCKTYWDCNKGHPHPVCCPDGMAYDIYRTGCFPNATCNDTCPEEYQDMCLKRSVTSYALGDGNCRTYMKCNELGQDDPYCCPRGKMYDAVLMTCVTATTIECRKTNCPREYSEECKFAAIPGKPSMYRVLDGVNNVVMPCSVGTKFDQNACQCVADHQKQENKGCNLAAVRGQPHMYEMLGVIMPCPVGTIFDQHKCQCVVIHAKTDNKMEQGCTLEIFAKLPALENLGSATAALLMLGAYGQGEKGVGDMPDYWDGNTGINIPYYGSEKLSNFYLELKFRPSETTMNKQVFLSSCTHIIRHQDTRPTLELSLIKFDDQSGSLNLHVGTTDQWKMVDMETQYMVNVTYIYRVIYDGHVIILSLERADSSTEAIVMRKELTGLIAIHPGGLRFAHCRYEEQTVASNFKGNVYEIKFSKCLTPEMKNILNDVNVP